MTKTLWASCSNQLSYNPVGISRILIAFLAFSKLEDDLETGFESLSLLHPFFLKMCVKYIFLTKKPELQSQNLTKNLKKLNERVAQDISEMLFCKEFFHYYLATPTKAGRINLSETEYPACTTWITSPSSALEPSVLSRWAIASWKLWSNFSLSG